MEQTIWTLSQSQTRLLDLNLFPDEILVNIGKSVAKVCGVHDFVMLSRTSKRLRRLLMHKETISDIVAEGNSRIHRNRSSMLLPSNSSEPIVVNTLEQLAFYECVREHNLLEENRFTPQLGSKVRRILIQHPSSVLVLDAHSGRGELMATTPYGHFDYRAKHAYDKIVATKSDIMEDRIRIRVWGRAVAEQAAESLHPYSSKARKGKGWVEVFFKIDGNGEEESDILELPPRPDFYSDLDIPQEQQYQNFVDFDSDED